MDNLELPQLDVEALAKTIIYALQGALRDDLREVENRYHIRIDVPINGALARTAEMIRQSVQQFDGARSEHIRLIHQQMRDSYWLNQRQPSIVCLPQDPLDAIPEFVALTETITREQLKERYPDRCPSVLPPEDKL